MYHLTIPIRTESEMNLREHWRSRAARAKEQRMICDLALSTAIPKSQLPENSVMTVRLTRVAPRKLDGDNLQGSFKHIRDSIAAALGVDDRSERYAWVYGQEKGKPKEYSVRITIAIDLKPE